MSRAKSALDEMPQVPAEPRPPCYAPMARLVFDAAAAAAVGQAAIVP